MARTVLPSWAVRVLMRRYIVSGMSKVVLMAYSISHHTLTLQYGFIDLCMIQSVRSCRAVYEKFTGGGDFNCLLPALVSKVKICDLRTLIPSCVSSTTCPAPAKRPSAGGYDTSYHRIYINAVVARKAVLVRSGGDSPQETLIFQSFRGGCPPKIAGHTSRSSSSKNAFALD